MNIHVNPLETHQTPYHEPHIPVGLMFPEQISKQKHYLDCDCHEGPALVADVALFSAGPDAVIVRQVNIKHQLSLHRVEPSACYRCRQPSLRAFSFWAAASTLKACRSGSPDGLHPSLTP